MYNIVGTLNKNPAAQVTTIQDKNGTVLVDSAEVLERWKEYTVELYHTEKHRHMPLDEETEII